MNQIAATAERGARDAAEKLIRTGIAADMESNVRAPATVVDADTGRPILVAARWPDDLGPVRRAFLAYPMTTTLRAVGTRNRSSVFGNVARNVVMQRNGCRQCSGARDAPAAHATIIGAAAVCAELLAQAVPDQAVADRALAAGRVQPEWRLPGGLWTSGVLNETSPLPYHYDRNNLPTWSAMIVARRGIEGGHLHIPEYNLVVECRDGDVVMFPGWKHVHGVTPMRRRDRDGYRYSAVFYLVEGMADCLSAAEETARAQRDRTDREATMLQRQADMGLLT